MADAVQTYSTSKYDDSQLGGVVESMKRSAEDTRKNFERRNYDNNFFDDGYHFRYLSRSQNKIVDLSERANLWAPMRAIPKTSRQIRGMVNLLVSQNYVPVIYPEKVAKGSSQQQMATPDQTGMNQGQQQQPQQDPAYEQAMEQSKTIARRTGHWIEEMIKQEEILEQKIPHMGILTAKNGISYLKIWPDPIEEQIRTTVRDFFDVYVMGSLTETKDSPFMGEGVPRSIAEIKADERFDPEQLKQISPDNKQASSDIKDAYMRANYGGEFTNAEYTSTLIQKEFFIKEYLNDENVKRIRLQDKGEDVLRRHTDSQGELKYGDPLFRQVFVAGNVTLAKSTYVNLPDYPYVDLRFEPGPIYQVPLIERFIPANKSLDMVVSRVERYTHTMVTGSWSIKAGEGSEPNNSAGGQIFNYRTTPPVQNQIAPLPGFIFNFMSLLNSYIQEQGTTLSTLGEVPQGVKGHAAIESLKESEYANLVIATKQLKKTMKRTAEKLLDIADDYFVSPQTVYYQENGEPQYYDVIGATGLKKRQDIGLMNDLSGDEVPLKRDYRVDIEVEQGLGYTKEGKKAAAKELGDWLIEMAKLGAVDPNVVKVFTQKLFDEYSFGPTEDIMEAMNSAIESGGMSPNQVQQIKVAVLEVMSDLIKKGVIPDQETRIQEGKVAVVEAIKDTGLVDKPKPEGKQVSESLSYKDAPEDIKRQIEMQAGLQPSQSISPSGIESATKLHAAANPSFPKGGANATSKGK